jgi:hypothetical protein
MKMSAYVSIAPEVYFSGPLRQRPPWWSPGMTSPTLGLGAASSMADAQQKIGQAHAHAVAANTVAEWTSVAQLASDGAAEVSDVSVGSPAIAFISQWASDANLHLNEITSNSGISDADAQTAALKGLASADACLLEAQTQPPPGGGTTTTTTSPGMSTSTKVALGVVAAAAVAAGGYVIYKSMKRGRR